MISEHQYRVRSSDITFRRESASDIPPRPLIWTRNTLTLSVSKFGNKFRNKPACSIQDRETAETKPCSYVNRYRHIIGSRPIVGSILIIFNKRINLLMSLLLDTNRSDPLSILGHGAVDQFGGVSAQIAAL